MSKNVKSYAKPFKVRPVPINQTRPAPFGAGQRSRLFPAHVDYFKANMDLNALGHPCVNLKDGVYWVFDGQHRIEALRQLGFQDDLLDCRVYEDLSGEDMAAMFLRVNTGKAVDVFSMFLNGCAAGYKAENDVRRIVEAQGLKISKQPVENSIGAVGACLKAYHAHGDVVLGKTLRTIRDSFDHAARSFEGQFIMALAAVFARYESKASEQMMVAALGAVKNGVVGVLRRADQLRLRVGLQRSVCISATLVDIYNKDARGGNRLPAWWRE